MSSGRQQQQQQEEEKVVWWGWHRGLIIVQKERGRTARLVGVHLASRVASERELATGSGEFRLRGDRLRNQFKWLLVGH